MVVVAPLRCLLICAAVLPLAAETLEPVHDLRLSVSAMPTPMVSENISDPNNSSTYDWRHSSYPGGVGLRMELGWWQGGALKISPPVTSLWMVGVNLSKANTTPDSYEIGSTTAPNTRKDLRTTFRQYGVAVGYGLATMPDDTELGDLHWELLPILRGGYGRAETVSPGLDPTVGSGHGLWWEGSLEGGLVLTADHWVFNPFIGVAYGKFSTSIDLPNDTTSNLTITTFAPLIGVRIGGSF